MSYFSRVSFLICLDMPLTKVCVHCSASVNVRKAVCACGHVFDSKKSSPATARRSKRIALNIRRALESAVEPLTPPLGKCTREDCMMMQLFDLCQDQLSARVLLRHINDKRQHNHVTCSAFGDMVYQLANLPNNHPVTAADLLKCQQIHEIQFLTDKKIITFVLRQT